MAAHLAQFGSCCLLRYRLDHSRDGALRRDRRHGYEIAAVFLRGFLDCLAEGLQTLLLIGFDQRRRFGGGHVARSTPYSKRAMLVAWPAASTATIALAVSKITAPTSSAV